MASRVQFELISKQVNHQVLVIVEMQLSELLVRLKRVEFDLNHLGYLAQN